MKLEQCTKAELIQLIKSLPDQGGVRNGLINIAYQRSMANFDKAKRILKEADNHFQKYIAIIRKYKEQGKKITNIPLAELKEANKHFQMYQKLNKEHDKIIERESKHA